MRVIYSLSVTATLALAHTSTDTTFPTSIDASSYLAYAFPTTGPQPTWATGQYYTTLASALYSVDKSFAERSDYATIIDAIQSAGQKAGDNVSKSIESSAWNWGDVTTNTWYSNVPKEVQTEVAQYVDAYASAGTSVEAVATGSSKAGAGGMPRCTGMAMAGVAAGMVAGVAGMM